MIMNAICPLAVVPVRAEPSDKSEIVSQLLFGETFSILEEKDNWRLIRQHLDAFEGWIDHKQALPVNEHYFNQISDKPKHFIADKTGVCITANDGSEVIVSKGSNLPMVTNGIFYIGERKYSTKSKIKIVPKKFAASRVAATAVDYLNAPYLWGGRSIMGIDCSGLVQVVYHMCGLDLPRNAAQQALKGEAIDFVDEVQPGDLAFFDNLAGDIIHVGIIIGLGKIIHASGRVKIDKIDHNGIFSSDLGVYSHSLRIIKRF
jgi:gamma-D-glutamyl-L-lysine dipeptidyl-peptidase